MTNKDYLHLLNILDVEEKKEMGQVANSIDKSLLEFAKNQCQPWHIDNACDVLGRQYKSTILKLYPLLYHIKRHIHNNVVYISQSDKHLLASYSYDHTRIHYFIHDVLIKKAKVLYDLKSEYTAHHIAKSYYVCTENLKTMLDLYNRIKREGSPKSIDDSRTLYEKDGYEYRLIPANYFYPSLSLNSKLTIHEAYSFEEIERVIFKQYIFIPYYQRFVERLNKNITREDEKIHFDLKEKYSKTGKITKLKMRAFSNVCLLKSWEKQKKKCDLQGIDAVVDPNIKYREQYLEERFGEYEEYDVHASVPRVARAVTNNGDMGDLEEDLYRTMFEAFVEDYQKHMNPSVTEWCDEVRQFFKMIFMRLFFGGTPKQIVRNILYREDKEKRKVLRQGYDIENLTPFSNIIQQGVDLVSLIAKWQDAVYEYCGRSKSQMHDTSVFFYESCIYLEVRRELAERGIDVVQVYDGFYFKKGTMPTDMNEIIKASALKYYQEEHKISEALRILKSSNSSESAYKEEIFNLIKNYHAPETPADLFFDDTTGHKVIYLNPNKLHAQDTANYKLIAS